MTDRSPAVWRNTCNTVSNQNWAAERERDESLPTRYENMDGHKTVGILRAADLWRKWPSA